MKYRQKFDYSLFLLSYFVTALLLLIGFYFGIKTVIWVVVGGLLVFVTLLSFFFFIPLRNAYRLYSECPPRKMYGNLSGKPDYCHIKDIPENLILAVRCAEDSEFFVHKGINWNTVIRAIVVNLSSGSKIVGGSTITQQVIKNVYLTPEVSMRRKLTEFLMVRRLEKELTKNEIMEVYLNVIYYGNGQYGITPASMFYYHVSPSELTFDQCVSLAAILPCPDKYNRMANPQFFDQMRQITYLRIHDGSYLTFRQLAELYVGSIENEKK